MKYDTEKVKDYVDDVDALLVFVSLASFLPLNGINDVFCRKAGLFSAILTAFVVQTYQLLQPDGTDVTNQLLAVSLTLRLADLSIPPAINDTLTNILTVQPFTPPASARWLNSLFFVSLVLSLAAALFGILAKQWLREYMRWNSPVGIPRENILVRQIRHEALESWRVSLIVTSIPALLEIAMTLFLAGIIILLWTIDNVVAIVITVTSGSFIILVSAFTILPIIFRHCPYRSPTAWALLVLYDVARYIIRSVRAYGSVLSHRWKYVANLKQPLITRVQRLLAKNWDMNADQKCQYPEIHWRTDAKTWREYDIEGCRITQLGKWWWQSVEHDVSEAARSNLARERTEFEADGRLAWDPRIGTHSGHGGEALLRDITETALLLRALSWSHRVFQDVHVGTYINQCMETIHPDIPVVNDSHAPYVVDAEAIRLNADWIVISSLWGNHLAEPERALKISMDTDGDVMDVRRTLGCRILTLVGNARIPPVLFQDPEAASVCTGLWEDAMDSSLNDKAALLTDLLAVDLQSSIYSLVQQIEGSKEDVHTRRIFELLCMLQSIPSSWKSPNPRWPRGTWHLDALRTILLDTNSVMFAFPGLRRRAFSMACDCAHLSISVGPDKHLGESV